MKLTCVVENNAIANSTLKAEHGLSFWVETTDGTLLWDTGQTEAALDHNMKKLGLDAQQLSAIALSHAHNDHTGGLLSILRQVSVPVHAHEDVFCERFNLKTGQAQAMGLDQRRAEIEAFVELSLSAEPTQILPQIKSTGTIYPRPYPMGASRNHVIRGTDGWAQDPYLDDISLVLSVSEGIVLLCGCCHSGLRNTIATVRAQCDEPLVAILGGTHLHDVAAEEMQAIIETLQAEGSPSLYLNHCTGDKALYQLKQVFGELVSPCPAGTVITF